MHQAPQHPELLRAIFWLVNGLALLLAGAALAWGIVMVRFYYRDGHRQRGGLCLRCGYDLRQTPGRCPECGEEPVHLARRKSPSDDRAGPPDGHPTARPPRRP